MAYLRTHVQFNHRVSIGDPISKWIHAAKVWDDKQSSSSSNSKVAPPSENKVGCEIAPDEPSVPAHRIKNSNSVNPGAQKELSSNEPIVTNTSTLGKREPNEGTLLALEKRITSAQSQFETRCAANESKTQADYNTNSSKISELTKQQTANALSQSQFETQCAATQSKLQELSLIHI